MFMENKKVAFVTGSGSGIGASIACSLASAGYLVVLNSRSADPANLESGTYYYKRLIESAGGVADVIRGDIGSREDRQHMVEHIVEKHQRLDLLVNNAGVAPRERKDILEQDEAAFDWLMNINLKGPWFLTQMLAKHMIKWKAEGVVETPRIAFITSISAYTSSTARGEYCASKAGLSMASQLYADRLGEYGIPVIEIRPGVIETPMITKVKDKYNKLIAEGMLPTPRLGQPEDVARVVTAFGRGDLDYSTGTAIDISGGFNIRRL
jgi:NAD(P)-dependent dehydrogenase (short-subunit alcohol dehydrogenase family)